MRAARALALVGVLGIAVYALYAAAMVALHPRYIYPFGQDRFDNPRFVQRAVDDVPVYVFDGGADAPVIVYFMGNLGALGGFAPMLDHHADKGRSVVAMGYRGGGGLPGQSSETSLKADARRVIAGLGDVLPNRRGPVIVQGYSLGTGLALHVAAHSNRVDGVILAAPYAQLCDLMTTAGHVPACYLPGVQKWQTLKDVPQVRSPVLILHGDRDDLVPHAQGLELAEALQAAGKSVDFVTVAGAGHVDLFGRPDYMQPLDAFIEAARE
ncbi:alpha/beta hydrolase [Antarctobacter sp.]|uniref:alpha/beta hydrolase n=1 Tax=Antarctobacter sp. TaxID=1872577 RepID=UPI003A913C04